MPREALSESLPSCQRDVSAGLAGGAAAQSSGQAASALRSQSCTVAQLSRCNFDPLTPGIRPAGRFHCSHLSRVAVGFGTIRCCIGGQMRGLATGVLFYIYVKWLFQKLGFTAAVHYKGHELPEDSYESQAVRALNPHRVSHERSNMVGQRSAIAVH